MLEPGTALEVFEILTLATDLVADGPGIVEITGILVLKKIINGVGVGVGVGEKVGGGKGKKDARSRATTTAEYKTKQNKTKRNESRKSQNSPA